MATMLAQVETQPKVTEIPKKSPQPIVPIKVGIFGGTGTGKTTTTALAALAISKTYHGGAPVFVTDTEPGWQFMAPLFQTEGVRLIQKTVPTFQAMCQDIRAAEREGACVWVVDSLTIIWQEILKAARGSRGFIPIDQWGSIKATWGEYTTLFLNSPMHCFALGRLQNDMEEIIDEDNQNKTKLVKVGTKFKAGGGESFGYEPHLLMELSLERKARRKAGIAREGEGRMVHRADVLKDRTWALNGEVIRWSDKAKYEIGGYRQVWQSFLPHFARVQQTMKLVSIQPGSSEALFDSEGNGEFYQMRQRKEALSGEIKAVMDMYWGGQGKEEKQMRLCVSDLVFGVKSAEARDRLTLKDFERGLRILQAFDRNVAKKVTDRDTTLKQIAECIREYDSGEAEIETLPF